MASPPRVYRHEADRVNGSAPTDETGADSAPRVAIDTQTQPRESMKLSIRRWRARYTSVLIGGVALLIVAGFAILVLAPEFRLHIASPWLWLMVGAFALSIVLYLRALYIIERINDDIEHTTKRAKRIALGDSDTTSPVPSVSVAELIHLNDAISAIARKAESDIAELKRLEQVRSEFLGNVSHELRTPIFSVQGYLETLLDGAIDDPEVREEFLEKAHNNMLRLHSLLNDLIEISRIESGAMKMSFRYFDLVSHCSTLIERLRSTADIADIDIRLETRGEDKEGKIMVLGDRKRLEQAMVNLIDNAIKYNRPGGEVLVSVVPDKKRAHITVSDTGIGIPSEHLGRIFERFYRVDKGRSRAIGGSGLGLAIVKHIIEAHGTQIAVQSSANVGTSFSFSLQLED